MDNSYFFSCIPAIKDHYEFLTPLILERSKFHPKRWVDPYCSIDWSKIFSPIEEYTWMAIRGFGKIPLYPQYPIGKYFIDFANPFLKVGIECDGKEYHQDEEKDAKRDKALDKLGWTIYRISGSDCFHVEDRFDADYDFYEREMSAIAENFYLNTVEGLIRALSIFYCDFVPFRNRNDEFYLAGKCLRNRTTTNKAYVEELSNLIPNAENWNKEFYNV